MQIMKTNETRSGISTLQRLNSPRRCWEHGKMTTTLTVLRNHCDVDFTVQDSEAKGKAEKSAGVNKADFATCS